MSNSAQSVVEFYSSLSLEQQNELGAKWVQDPAAALDEAMTLAQTSGYSFDKAMLEATVKAFLEESSDVDIELTPELMAAVAGGKGSRTRRPKRSWFGSSSSSSSSGKRR